MYVCMDVCTPHPPSSLSSLFPGGVFCGPLSLLPWFLRVFGCARACVRAAVLLSVRPFFSGVACVSGTVGWGRCAEAVSHIGGGHNREKGGGGGREKPQRQNRTGQNENEVKSKGGGGRPRGR